MTRAGIYAGKAVVLIQATDLTEKTIGVVQRRLAGLNNQLGQLGRTAFTTGFFSATGQGILLKRFAKFDDLMLELRVKMGLLKDVSREQELEFARLERRIRSLGKTTSYTTQEVAEGAIRLAQAGFSSKEIEDTLQSVLDLARGTSTDLGNAARVLANTIRTFNIETESANQIVSQFVKAARLGTVEIDDLAEGLKYSSATAVELGQSLSTVLAVFTLLSEKGMRGSIAGTSFNTAMANMTKKAEAISLMTGLPLPTDANGNLLLVDMLKQLETATRSLPGIERVKIFQDLFNLRGSRAALALAHESDIQKLIKVADSIAIAGDEARLAAQIMDSELGGATRRTLSALDDLNITLQKIIAKPLTAFLNALPPIINLLDRFALSNRGLVATISALPVALVAGGLGLMAFSRTLGIVAKLLGTVKSSFSFLKPLLSSGLAAKALNYSAAGGAIGAKGIGGSLSRVFGSYPIGAASSVPGVLGSQRAAALLNARLAPQAALYEAAMSTSAGHAAQQYKIYKRNQHLARLGGPNVAAHIQRAAIAKQAFKNAQANKKAASMGLAGIKSRMVPIPARAAKANVLGSVLKGIGSAGKGVKSLFDLTKGFAAFTWSIAKLATKANVLMMVLQVLLLFGDRIPGVSSVLGKISAAFGAFFGTISTLVTRLVPVFQLFKLSIGMLGNSQTSDLGIQGLITALSAMGQIVGTTLVEAWNRFKATLGSVYNVLRNTVVIIWELGKAIMNIAVNSIGNVIGGVFSAASSRISAINQLMGGGDTNWVDIFKQAIAMFAQAVLKLFEWVGFLLMKLNNVFLNFVDDMHIMLLEVVGEAAKAFWLPDRTGAARETIRGAKGERNVQFRRDVRANEEAATQALNKIIDALNSNAAFTSGVAADEAANKVNGLLESLRAYMMELSNAEAGRLFPPAGTSPDTPRRSGASAAAAEIRQAAMQSKIFAAALVGTVAGTRGNTIRAVTEDELKKQTDLLQEIRDNTAQQANAAFV